MELLEIESVKTAILGFLDILDVVAKELNWQKYFNVNCKWSIWKIECAYCIDADTINRKKSRKLIFLEKFKLFLISKI